MSTQCNPGHPQFQALGKRTVTGTDISSDGGSPRPREVDGRLDVTARPAVCFTDPRDSARAKHPARYSPGRRIPGVRTGCEDANDRDEICEDSMFAATPGAALRAKALRTVQSPVPIPAPKVATK